MPVIKVIVHSSNRRHSASVVFPRRAAATAGESPAWQWDEVHVAESSIAGSGLLTSSSPALAWSDLRRPALLPLLGVITTCRNAPEACVLTRVLQGRFRRVQTGDALDGVTVGEPMLVVPSPSEEGSFTPLAEAEAVQRLQVPPHMLELLAAHERHHHADRHFATHVIEFERGAQSVLVNAHPAFGNAAFAAGAINEPPPTRAPTLEIRKLRIEVDLSGASKLVQQQWREFAAAFPEVLEPHPFFATLRKSYRDGAELTACYGANFERRYAAWGFPTPVRYALRLPPEIFSFNAEQESRWPHCAAWHNPLLQPLGRPAFARGADGSFALVDDLPEVVLAHEIVVAAGADEYEERFDGVTRDACPEFHDAWEESAINRHAHAGKRVRTGSTARNGARASAGSPLRPPTHVHEVSASGADLSAEKP